MKTLLTKTLLKYFFIFFLFYPYNVFAQAHIVKSLLWKTIPDRPIEQNLDELEREVKSFIENIYPDNMDHFRNGTALNTVKDMADDLSLSDLNFMATVYSVAIKYLPLENLSRDPHFYLLAKLTFELEASRGNVNKVAEIAELISNPYFYLPSIDDDVNNYRQIIFDYIGENFDHIHTKGYGRKILNKWWPDEDFREIVFNSIEKKHIQDSDTLLKWWKEDKERGTGRFENLISVYIRKLHIDEKISEDDLFWITCLTAIKNSIHFAKNINDLLFNIRNYSPETIKTLGTERLQTLTPEQLQSLSISQIEAFTPEQLKELNPVQRRSLIRVIQ